MESNWINVHTHRPGAGVSVFDPCLGETILPADGKVYRSLGIHPLYIDDLAGERLKEIEKAASEGKIVAVGEAGLDRNSSVPMEEQMIWLERQAKIAVRYNLPLIIHGVRAIPEIITVYNRCPVYQKWIIHGFNNRREILQDLLRHGFYISVGRQTTNKESNVFQLLPEIPSDRLFIETDNSDFSIEDIYRKVADRRGVGLSELQQTVLSNFEKLFTV